MKNSLPVFSTYLHRRFVPHHSRRTNLCLCANYDILDARVIIVVIKAMMVGEKY
jgi:hypothetical protein